MRIVILSDFHRGSFRIVGDLYESTFRELGFETIHLQTAESSESIDAIRKRYSGSIFCHNTVGRSFAPFEGERNIAFVLHEWSRYPPEWIPYLNGFDDIWVTTRHLKNVLEDSGSPRVPNEIPPSLGSLSIPQKTDWPLHTPTRFLYVGEAHFRKGLHLLFRAWEIAFPEPNQAQLTIKTSAQCGFDSPRSDIRIIKSHLEENELHAMYSEHDYLVSASLGEGWGLPIAEAILARLPVVANMWGGHGSMLSTDNCFAIPHTEVDQLYCSLPELYAPEQKCGFSNPTEISQALLRAAASSAKERELLTQNALTRLEKQYGQKEAGARIATRLNTLYGG